MARPGTRRKLVTAVEANQYIDGFLKTLPGDISVRPLLLACANLRVSALQPC